jgi:hypothetical protein
MSSRVTFDAYHRAGREDGDPAEAGDDGPLLVREQSPETLGRNYLVQVHITVGGLRSRSAGRDRYWFYDEPSGFC